jgi:hypothetical protein
MCRLEEIQCLVTKHGKPWRTFDAIDDFNRDALDFKIETSIA